MRSPDASPTLAALAQRIAATLPGSRVDHLARVLAAHPQSAADYEGSVRGGSAGSLRAGRMMIERASAEVVEAIAAALGVGLPAPVSPWLSLARGEGLPMIAGWDVRGGGEHRCVKLYVNASDASDAVRRRIGAALVPGCEVTPAVIGMNARADGITEIKLYVQAADALALTAGLDPRARALATGARAEGADAGGVLSFDAGSPMRARAFFVALREPPHREGWDCVRSLPGYDEATIASLLPFAPAPPRSVGVSLTGGEWTLYFKPQCSGRAPEALEPTAIFRDGSAEVGVFIEPTEHAARAFRRTERHAISIRVRAGAPTPAALESLVDWFAGRVRVVERTHASLHMRVNDPPAPWHIVDGSGSGELA